MAGDPFARMHARLFAGPLSEEAFLRGEAIRVLPERGSQQIGEDGQVLAHRVVVGIPVSCKPREEDPVVLAEGAHVIDALLDDDGYSVRCVLRPE